MLLITCLLTICVVNGEKGFIYPDTMPTPHEITVYNGVFLSLLAQSNKLETPIVIRLAHIYQVGIWNSVAQYDANALDALTKKRPIVTELPNDKYLNSYTRAMCLCYTALKIQHHFSPKGTNWASYLYAIFNIWGLTELNPEIDENVINCNHNKECLTKLAINNNFIPSFMSNIVAYEIITYFNNDGWNYDGSLNNDGECTANCKPYSDTTRYEPKSFKKKKKNKNSDAWVPLLESDNKGFFYKHEHVTPHIGITAKPFLSDKIKKASPPNYDYDLESDLLLERLKVLATNDTMKMMVELFDDKLTVRQIIRIGLLNSYPDRLSFEDLATHIIGISTTEYDTLLTAWNQKREYDLIRPTTVIQRKGSQLITTYGGPYEGVKTFEAKDFEPYIRVMPHSEYPSGSACLCQGYMEFELNFVKNEFDDDELYNMYDFYMAGSSKIEPATTPKEDMILRVNNMEHLYEICSESRLWGGMHFTTSIHSAKQICSGIGTAGYQYAKKLRGKSGNNTFLGSVYASDHDYNPSEYWFQFTKVYKTLTQLSFADLLNGNVDLNDLDPDILIVIRRLFPSVGELTSVDDLFGLLVEIILSFKTKLLGNKTPNNMDSMECMSGNDNVC